MHSRLLGMLMLMMLEILCSVLLSLSAGLLPIADQVWLLLIHAIMAYRSMSVMMIPLEACTHELLVLPKVVMTLARACKSLMAVALLVHIIIVLLCVVMLLGM